MENKETKKYVVDNVVVAVLLCDYSPVHVLLCRYMLMFLFNFECWQ